MAAIVTMARRRTAGATHSDSHTRAVVRSELLRTSEHKIQDTSLSAQTPIPATPVITSVVQLAQGTDWFNRLGAQVTLHALTIHWRVTLVSTTAPQCTMRIMVFIDDECEQAVPTLSGAVTSVMTGPTLEEQQNPLTLTRYRMLRDKYVTVSTGSPLEVAGRMKIRLHNHKVSFLGVSSAVADYGRGNIFMAIVSNTTTNPSLFNARARIMFTDA